MIQRIQSFYLILAACALALCFMFPVATFEAVNADNGTRVHASLNLLPQKTEADILSKIEQGAPEITMPQKGCIHTWPLATVVAVCIVIAVVSVFLYKNRMTQVNVVAFGFLLNVVYLFLVFIWAFDAYEEAFLQFSILMHCAVASATYSIATWSSVVSLLFFFLAQRAIKKDEAKVRAADRLR